MTEVSNVTKTFIAMIVDETGSMSYRRDTAIESTNEFINAHSAIEECYASLITFDAVRKWGLKHKSDRQQVRFLAEGVSIKDVPKLTRDNYNPHGMTNLNDAIGQTIRHMEDVTKDVEDPIIIVMINTDGDENASKEYNDQAIKAMINEKKDAGWEFVFIAEELTDKQARQMAATRGISADMLVNVSGHNKAATFKSMASATTLYASDCAKGAAGPRGPQGDSGLSGYMTNITEGDK